MDLKSELKKRIELANSAVMGFLPAADEHPGSLAGAMRYSVEAGGKRVRPILMLECCALFGGDSVGLRPFMAAMEYIHTASLIHDDLPAIDNDTMRRGMPTVHAEYGEAVGILAGDALLNHAYETLILGISGANDKDCAVRAVRTIAEKSGSRGMLGGQGADVENEKTGIRSEKDALLRYIYEKKTAALIEASMMAGAEFAGADSGYIDILESAGRKTGLAFQIYDDILDVRGSSEKLGKPVNSDEKNNKETYVSLFGIEEAETTAKRLTGEAIQLIGSLPGDTEFLKAFISYLITREM